MSESHSLLPDPAIRRVEILSDEVFLWEPNGSADKMAQVR
jgi:hypothetical protein